MSSNNFIAGGTIQPATFVVASSSADNTVLQASGTTTPPIGVTTISSKNPPIYNNTLEAADNGDPVTVFGLGEIAMLTAGSGGYTHGQFLTSDANGNGVPASAGQYVGAIALQSTAYQNQGRVQVVIFKY